MVLRNQVSKLMCAVYYCNAHSSLPSMGARPLICVPSAARTCCDVSDTRSSTLVMISFKRVSLSSNAQNP